MMGVNQDKFERGTRWFDYGCFLLAECGIWETGRGTDDSYVFGLNNWKDSWVVKNSVLNVLSLRC